MTNPDLGGLFLYDGQRSPAVELAPAHMQGAHAGHRAALCLHTPFPGPIPSLSGPSYTSPPIRFRAYAEATLSHHYGSVADAAGQLVAEAGVAATFMEPAWPDSPAGEIARQPATQRLPGHFVYGAHGHYCVFAHVLFETVCTAFLMREVLVAGRARLILPGIDETWPGAILEMLGIPRTAFGRLRHRNTRLQNLILSSTCSGSHTFSPHPVMKQVAAHFLARWGSQNGPRRRLYLTRAGSATTSQRELLQDAELSRRLG